MTIVLGMEWMGRTGIFIGHEKTNIQIHMHHGVIWVAREDKRAMEGFKAILESSAGASASKVERKKRTVQIYKG